MVIDFFDDTYFKPLIDQVVTNAIILIVTKQKLGQYKEIEYLL